MVDSGFSSDRTVDLSQQGGGNLSEGNAAQKGCRGKACHIADDSAAQGDQPAAAVEALLDQAIVNRFQGGEVLELFPVGDGDGCDGIPFPAEQTRQPFTVQGQHRRVGNNCHVPGEGTSARACGSRSKIPAPIQIG